MANSVGDRLRIDPGSSVDLSTIDTRATPGAPGGKAATGEALAAHSAALAEYQERLYAEGTLQDAGRSVLLILQGMDTSGKGGTIEHVAGAMNPQGLRIVSFKKPTPEELRHHFLWRIRRGLPKPGIVGIFDRSQYEDVLVVRVHNLVEEAVWSKRYGEINRFEEKAVAAGTTLIKLFLHISHEEQRERLIARLDDPAKHWKFRAGDIDERARWNDYTAAYSDALERCSTEAAPWHVVPADRKWYRNWAVAQLLAETFRELDPQYPQPQLDVPRLKQRLLAT